MNAEVVRLVVVDDIQDVADTLAMQLELDGYAVVTAYSAEQAILAIEQSHPHGVVFDIGMPGIDGHELATLLRHRFKNQIVLVAMTGWDLSQPRVSATIEVADHCLRKPVDLTALREIFSLGLQHS